MTEEVPFSVVTDELWLRGDISYKLWPQQEPIYNGIRALPKKVESVVILCARQFGKSHLGVMLALEDCLRYPNKCILVMGPTLKQTRDIVTPRIRDIGRDAPPGLIRPSKSEGKWYVGESELVIGGFDQNSSSQRGKTVQTIYVEEIVDSNPDDYNDSMRSDLGPALTHSDGGKMIFLTTPPKIPDHPFITDTMAQAELNGALYTYTINDNKQLTEEQYDACVRRSGGITSSDWKREYLCLLIRDASVVVVPDYDDAKHARPFEQPSRYIPQVTIDFGGVRDKTVALFHWFNFYEARIEIWDERVWGANTATSKIVADVYELERHWGVHPRRIIDCPGQLQVDLIAQGFDCATPHKEDWQAGVNQMAVAFTLGKALVHPRCVFLRQSLKSGTFNRNRTDFERSIALGHCDALAALMYGIRSQDTSNPYPAQHVGQGYMRRPPSEPEREMAEAILGAPLGSASYKPKRFGTFNA